jgi:glutaredoxin 3
MKIMRPSKPIEIYVIYGCPYCKAAVRILRHMRVPFEAINLGNKPDLATQLASSTGSSSVPKVFIHGNFIGGYTELAQMASSGQLESMLMAYQ